MSLVDSALKSAKKLTDGMGNGGVAAVHASNKLFGEGFELTCLGWAIRGVDPVNLCSWEEVNHVGDGKPNELGFVQDFSYKYKINAVHYYGYPQKLQETQFFVDDLGPLKTKLREYKKEEYMRESVDFDGKTYEDLLGDYVCIRSFRHGNMGEVCRKGYHYKVDEIAPDGRVVINGFYVGLDFLKDHFEKVEDKMTVSEAMEVLKESGKKAINESYLEEVNVEELYSLALESLFFADQVHLWHWTCKSGFHHTHLQEVYESLRDFADELVEICLASGKKFQVKANTRELGGDGDFDVQDAIDEIEEFIDQIQATAEKFDEYSEITTLIDDEAKALTKELGLLKSFS